MEATAPSLLRRVFECRACPGHFGFQAGPGTGYLKFPPTIGATGKSELLFVAINPRLSGNRPWLERLMRDREEFRALAENRKDGKPYIETGGSEPHYELHARIVRDVFGPAARFEDHAAVTELFFCATANTGGSFPAEGSDCADEYFGDVLAQVQPKAIVCVGERVLKYMRTRFGFAGQRIFELTDGAKFVCVPHPGNYSITDASREVAIREAVQEISETFRRP